MLDKLENLSTYQKVGIGVGVLVVLLVTYSILSKKEKKEFASNGFDPSQYKDNPSMGIEDFPSRPIMVDGETVDYDKKLSLGSRGIAVQILQERLGVTKDGIFGAKTLAALKKATGKLSITLNEMPKWN